MTKTVTVLSGLIRPLVETRLPDWVEPRFFRSKDEALSLAPDAEIGWFDIYDKKDMAAIITAATNLKWLNSIYAGVDGMPLDLHSFNAQRQAEYLRQATQVKNIWVPYGA